MNKKQIFNIKFILPVVVGLILVVATVMPAISAGDHLKTDFRQCANEDPTSGDCHWISSIVQESNSMYYEGMSVPQRAVFTNIPVATGNDHTLIFSHQTTKGGIHAYDWLTSYDQAKSAAANAGVPFNDLDGQTCDDEIGPPGDLGTTCEALQTGAYCLDVEVPNDLFISKDGLTQDRIDAYEAVYGNRTIRICGDAAINSASLSLSHSVSDGEDTGDSDINYILDWNSVSTQILIQMAGHLSVSGEEDIAWGVGLGSSQISGGPYHFNLKDLDTSSLGSQDNQVKGADIIIPEPRGSITLDKVTDPTGDQTSFDFLTSNLSPADPSLTDQAAPVVWTDLADGTYSITETLLENWELTVDCTGMTNSTITPIENGVEIELLNGENITCTFTNTDTYEPPTTGTLIVRKVLINDNGGTTATSSFSFSINDDAPISFEEDGENVIEDLPVDTTYSIVELPANGYDTSYDNCTDVTIPAGGSAICTITNDDIQPTITVIKEVQPEDAPLQAEDFELFVDGVKVINGVASDLFDAGVHWVTEAPDNAENYVRTYAEDCNEDGSIDLSIGQNAVCKIVNLFTPPEKSTIIIRKETLPGGDETVFSVTGDIEGDFSTAAPIMESVDPNRPYVITESIQEGWKLVNIDCNGNSVVNLGSATATVNVGEGETITCTFINGKTPTLKITKNIDPSDDQGAFYFFVDQENWNTKWGYNPLGNGGIMGPHPIDVGTYTITEEGAHSTQISDYTTYFGGDCAEGTVTLDYGDNKVCSVLNTKNEPEPEPETDLELTKDVDDQTVDTGQQVTYLVNVTNHGPYPAENVEVTDALPAGLTFVSASATKGSYSTSANIWTIGEMAVSEDPETLTIVAEVTATSGTTIINEADVTLDPNIDINTENNHDEIDITVNELPPPPPPVCTENCGGGGGGGGGGLIYGSLIVKKIVVNDNGGTASPQDFLLYVKASNGSNVANSPKAGSETGTYYSIPTGAYTVSEDSVDGYNLTFSGDCAADGSVVVGAGVVKTCILTNDDVAQGEVLGESIVVEDEEPPIQVLAETGADLLKFILLAAALSLISTIVILPKRGLVTTEK